MRKAEKQDLSRFAARVPAKCAPAAGRIRLDLFRGLFAVDAG